MESLRPQRSADDYAIRAGVGHFGQFGRRRTCGTVAPSGPWGWRPVAGAVLQRHAIGSRSGGPGVSPQSRVSGRRRSEQLPGKCEDGAAVDWRGQYWRSRADPGWIARGFDRRYRARVYGPYRVAARIPGELENGDYGRRTEP